MEACGSHWRVRHSLHMNFRNLPLRTVFTKARSSQVLRLKSLQTRFHPKSSSSNTKSTAALSGLERCNMAAPDPSTLNAGMASLSIEEANEATPDDQQGDHTTTLGGESVAPVPTTRQQPSLDSFAISVGALQALNRTRRAAGLTPLSVEDVEQAEERGEEEDYLEALQVKKREARKARRQEQCAKQQAKKKAKRQAKKTKHGQTLSQKQAEKQALKEQKKQEMEAELEEKRAVRAQLAEERAQRIKEAAIVTLIGSDYRTFKLDVLKDKILRAIAENLAANPDMALLGRTDNFFRINYDPTARDVSSIWNRLDQVFSTKSDQDVDYMELDRLLCPLILSKWNIFHIRHWEIQRMFQRLDERSYRSNWIHNQAMFNEIRPITLAKRDAVISSVVEAMTKKCRKADPNSLLLLSPYVNAGNEEETEHRREWDLSSLYSGLASRVRECFEGPEVECEMYEDRIEQVLYSYKMANPTAIYGAS